MNLDDEFRLGYEIIQKIAWSWAYRYGTKGWIYYASNHFAGPRFYPSLKAWNAAGQGWGYLDYFFCPRWPYATLSAFLHHFAGAKDDGILLDNANLYVIRFRKNQDTLLAFFAIKSDSKFAFEHDGVEAQLIDPFGNVVVTSRDKWIEAEANRWPHFYRLTNANSVQLSRLPLPNSRVKRQ
jgi:hypothetical protein